MQPQAPGGCIVHYRRQRGPGPYRGFKAPPVDNITGLRPSLGGFGRSKRKKARALEGALCSNPSRQLQGKANRAVRLEAGVGHPADRERRVAPEKRIGHKEEINFRASGEVRHTVSSDDGGIKQPFETGAARHARATLPVSRDDKRTS